MEICKDIAQMNKKDEILNIKERLIISKEELIKKEETTKE